MDDRYSVRVVDNSEVNRRDYPVVSLFLQNDFRAAPLSLSPDEGRRNVIVLEDVIVGTGSARWSGHRRAIKVLISIETPVVTGAETNQYLLVT